MQNRSSFSQDRSGVCILDTPQMTKTSMPQVYEYLEARYVTGKLVNQGRYYHLKTFNVAVIYRLRVTATNIKIHKIVANE